MNAVCDWHANKNLPIEESRLELLDSRRLTGPNLLWDFPGAVIEAGLEPGESAAQVVEAWQSALTSVLTALDLPVRCTTRVYPGGVSLAFAAASDMLYTATEINEWAFNVGVLQGQVDDTSTEAARKRFAQALQEERDPKLIALEAEARRRGVNFCGDDEWTTLGMGARGRTWDTPELPSVDEVDWDSIEDVPSVLVTGTNGKTTTVRLLVAIAKTAGRVPGASSTDWIQVRG